MPKSASLSPVIDVGSVAKLCCKSLSIRPTSTADGTQAYGRVVVGQRFRSRAMRAAVRFFAATIDAFFARAERSSGVMFFAAVLPPFAPICAIACRNTSLDSCRTALSYRLGEHKIDVRLDLDHLTG